MSILAVSVSHKTTSVEVLSRVAMDTPVTTKLVDALLHSEHVDEVVVLSTCNRTEIYAEVSRFHGGLDDVTSGLAQVSGISVGEVRSMCAVFFDEGAVAHTFSVTAGLESMVVGESQVLGQVRAALRHCQGLGSVGSVLNALFQQALRVGKRVHSETAVGSAGRSLVSAAYAELTAQCGTFAGRRLVVVGAGSMANLAARTAAAGGAEVTIVNRHAARGERLAEAVGGRSLAYAAMDRGLAEADFVVTCTGAAGWRISAADLLGTPVIGLVDLALPADVAPDVVESGVVLVNLAGLATSQLDSATSLEVDGARALVASEVSDFLSVRRAAQVAPTVVALRSMASEIVAAELTRLDTRLPTLAQTDRDEVACTVRRVADKLLHQPTVRVQSLSGSGEGVDYEAALRELFALDPQTVAAVISAELPRP